MGQNKIFALTFVSSLKFQRETSILVKPSLEYLIYFSPPLILLHWDLNNVDAGINLIIILRRKRFYVRKAPAVQLKKFNKRFPSEQ